jgi:mannuronan 5-epimerase
MRNRSRAGGYLVVVAVVLGIGLVATFVLGRSYSRLALQQEPLRRAAYVPSFDPIEDVTLGLPPNSTNRIVSKPDAAIRAIEVYPTQTIMLAGGRAVRSIDMPAPPTLHRLARVIASPRWIAESGSKVTLNAALVIEHGSSMRIAAPVTSELVMNVRPGVFLAAALGELTLTGVDVHASDTKVPGTFAQPAREAGRPFILASAGSTMTVRRCTFRYLGRDWNSSYGLSWSKGSTGSVSNSVFAHDFIGVYSNGAEGLRVKHNQFYHNSLYGVDPHSGSSHLLIEYNTADFNGRHGIIFSDHVTDGVVRYNVAKGNTLNGIMMDKSSTDNIITHNTVVGNKSDGIVIANSSNNVVSANAVAKNRVGITVRGNTEHTVISGNTIADNVVAAQGTGLSGNRVYGNGGEWSARRIGLIWLGTLALLLVLLGATWSIRQRRSGR